MSCASCASSNQREFAAEINVHFRGLENIDNPGILVFAKLLVCLDCGFSRFILTEQASRRIGSAIARDESSLPKESLSRSTSLAQDCD